MANVLHMVMPFARKVARFVILSIGLSDDPDVFPRSMHYIPHNKHNKHNTLFVIHVRGMHMFSVLDDKEISKLSSLVVRYSIFWFLNTRTDPDCPEFFFTPKVRIIHKRSRRTTTAPSPPLFTPALFHFRCGTSSCPLSDLPPESL